MADAVGLGKTIEVGILLSELIRRGKGKRILVVTTKSMMTQFQKELWSRFTIPLVRLDRAGIDRIRQELPSDANPFHYHDKTIISVDTLKQERDFRVHLEKSYWDVIVIDEAHNVAVRGDKSLRAKLAEQLAKRSDSLILASATPHDGRPASFASLMNMLNPTAITDPDHYGPADISGLFLRRFKKDVKDQMKAAVHDRKTFRYPSPASDAEEQAYSRLTQLEFSSLDKTKRSGQLLFRTVLEKALFSSPAACLQTVRQRIKKLEAVTSPGAQADIASLQRLETAVAAITPKHFSKYQKLLALLEPGGQLNWEPSNPKDRLVIFTERVDTLNFLREHLREDLKLKPGQIATLNGQENDDKQVQDTVEAFGPRTGACPTADRHGHRERGHQPSPPLLEADPFRYSVVSDGLPAAQRAHRPLRAGKSPAIVYLTTKSGIAKIAGDERILELLTHKDEQAQKNIGDPSAFQGVYDEFEQELQVGRAIEQGKTPEQYEAELEKNAKATDFLAEMFADLALPTGPSANTTADLRKRDLPSLFPTDLDYVVEGLERAGNIDYTVDRDRQLINVTLNEDLRRMFRRALPKDAIPASGRIHLTTDRQFVQTEIRKAREGEQRWPEAHLLWDLHPVVEWLNYKLLVNFARAEAPVVTLRGVLDRGEVLFLMQGEIPDRKAQPVVHSWFAVHFNGGVYKGILPFDAFIDRTRFGSAVYPNPSIEPNLTPLQTLLPEAIQYARRWMSERRAEITSLLDPKLREQEARLEHLHGARRRQLESSFPPDTTQGIRLQQKNARSRQVDSLFSEYREYVRQTLQTEDTAFIRVAAVFNGEETYAA